MKRIFEHMGGVPPRLRFDNMTTAVAQVLRGTERFLTEGCLLYTSLRRTLFLVMGVLLQCAPMDEPVYQFMNKKRSEGKPLSLIHI